jgi:hypothetical protein
MSVTGISRCALMTCGWVEDDSIDKTREGVLKKVPE